MANKRDLKRGVKFLCNELLAECVATSLYVASKQQEDINAVITSILILHDNYIRRISHPEPGMKAKVYYKTLISDFNNEISEIIDQICNMQ